MFDYSEVLANVPHRYPFLLIDKVIGFEAHKFAITIKNVSLNEAQFSGHFPGKPIMPGVYLIENMAQAACFLLAKSGDGIDASKVYVLGKVSKMSFLAPVFPGDILTTRVNLEKKFGSMALASATAAVGDKIVAKGELYFSAIPSN